MPLGRLALLRTGRLLGRERGGVAERAVYWRRKVPARGMNRGSERKWL